MADISSLGQLKSSEPLDMDVYVGAREGAPFPKAGTYMVQAPESFEGAFSRSNAGFLKVNVDPTIVGPTNEGYKIRFASVSAKTYPRKAAGGKSVPASQIGDYLSACGVEGKVDGDPQALANAVEQTAGRTYKVQVDWRAYNKNNPAFAVKGMDKFPLDANGERQPWITDPDDVDPETNEPRRLRANLEIVRFVSAS